MREVIGFRVHLSTEVTPLVIDGATEYENNGVFTYFVNKDVKTFGGPPVAKIRSTHIVVIETLYAPEEEDNNV